MPCLSPHDPSLIVIAHIWTWGLWRLHPTEIIQSVRIGPETLSEKTANPRYIRTPPKKDGIGFQNLLYLWKDCEPMISFQSWDHDISGPPPKKQAWKTTQFLTPDRPCFATCDFELRDAHRIVFAVHSPARRRRTRGLVELPWTRTQKDSGDFTWWLPWLRLQHVMLVDIPPDWNLECQPRFPKFSGLNLECQPNGIS